MCGIAIQDDNKRSEKEKDEMDLVKCDRDVMDVLKLLMDGELSDEDLLPEHLKMKKVKLIKGILTLFPGVAACDEKTERL